MPFGAVGYGFCVSSSMVLRENSALFYAYGAYAPAAFADIFKHGKGELPPAMSVTSVIGRSKRISGLSVPYVSIACCHVMRTKAWGQSP